MLDTQCNAYVPSAMISKAPPAALYRAVTLRQYLQIPPRCIELGFYGDIRVTLMHAAKSAQL